MKRVYRGLKRFGHEALRNHVLETARRGRSRHPDLSDQDALQALLSDQEVVRFDTSLRFDAARLQEGFFAEAHPVVTDGSKRFELLVHPRFEGRGPDLACLVAYHIPSINYGKMASSDDAEAFGAALLGMDVDAYYARVCALADELV